MLATFPLIASLSRAQPELAIETVRILLRQIACLPPLTLRAEPATLTITVEKFLWDVSAQDDASAASIALDGLAALATQRGSLKAHVQLCAALLSPASQTASKVCAGGRDVTQGRCVQVVAQLCHEFMNGASTSSRDVMIDVIMI
jgi:hypothetical protein